MNQKWVKSTGMYESKSAFPAQNQIGNKEQIQIWNYELQHTIGRPSMLSALRGRGFAVLSFDPQGQP